MSACLWISVYLCVQYCFFFRFTEYKLTFENLNDTDKELSSNDKVNILCKTTKLLQQLYESWVELPSIQAIMAPTAKLLQSLCLENYPERMEKAVERLQLAIEFLPTERHVLVRGKGKPTGIKMYEPQIEKM